MTLAGTIAVGEPELICDLAETYGILDYRQLPPKTVAVLVAGLRDDSRIKQKITGVRIDLKEQLLAVIADRLGALMNAWGGDVDFSLYDRLMGIEREQENSSVIKGQVFSSVEDFVQIRYGGLVCQADKH